MQYICYCFLSDNYFFDCHSDIRYVLFIKHSALLHCEILLFFFLSKILFEKAIKDIFE